MTERRGLQLPRLVACRFLQYEYTATLGRRRSLAQTTTLPRCPTQSKPDRHAERRRAGQMARDYTATNGTSIVLTSGAAAGDLLQVIAFKSFTVADMVPASTGGTFSGSVTVNGNLTVNGLGNFDTAVAATNTTSSTGSVTLDFSANQNHVLTLTGSVTLDNPRPRWLGSLASSCSFRMAQGAAQ
jgi:hypothetical protein